VSHDEAACLKCGRCCRVRIEYLGEVFVLPWHRCEHFDRDTKLCKAYEVRFDTPREEGRCLTVEEGIRARAYPRDCPYVRGLKGYRPPIEMPDESMLHSYMAWW